MAPIDLTVKGNEAENGITQYLVGMATRSDTRIGILINLRRTMDEYGYAFDRVAVNAALRKGMRLRAENRDAQRDAEIRCINQGHAWRIRSQEAWDNGYDEPVHCICCGAWDM